MIFDSNLVIYAAKPEYPGLRALMISKTSMVSLVTKLETLGFHKLTEPDRVNFEQFFASVQIHPVSEDVIERAIVLRQSKKMSVPDSIIAATALLLDDELATNNTKDFLDIPVLKLVNPIAAGDPPIPAA